MLTLEDIAKQAGVSKAAVWAALSDRHTSIVLSPVTKEKIRKIARELNYQPNMNARSLAKKKSFIISYLCRINSRKDASFILEGMQNVLHDRGYSALAYIHGDTLADELANLRQCVARQSEAVIVTPALDQKELTNAEHFQELVKEGVPVVQIYNRILPGIPAVVIDGYEMGRKAVRHLIEKGHRQIAHVTIAGYGDDKLSKFYCEQRARWRGYTEAMKAAGLEPVTFTIDSTHPNSQAQACKLAKSILGHAYKPTAIIAFNDSMAVGLRKGIREAGLRVPEDISLIGYDGISVLINEIDDELTTFVKPLYEIGREAAQMCLDLLEGKAVEDVVCEPDLHMNVSVSARK